MKLPSVGGEGDRIDAAIMSYESFQEAAVSGVPAWGTRRRFGGLRGQILNLRFLQLRHPRRRPFHLEIEALQRARVVDCVLQLLNLGKVVVSIIADDHDAPGAGQPSGLPAQRKITHSSCRPIVRTLKRRSQRGGCGSRRCTWLFQHYARPPSFRDA